MLKLFIGNLPGNASESSVRKLFSTYGTVRSINVAADIFTGHCKGFATVEMEGHEARAAQAALDGHMSGSETGLRVRFERSGGAKRGRGRGRR